MAPKAHQILTARDMRNFRKLIFKRETPRFQSDSVSSCIELQRANCLLEPQPRNESFLLIISPGCAPLLFSSPLIFLPSPIYPTLPCNDPRSLVRDPRGHLKVSRSKLTREVTGSLPTTVYRTDVVCRKRGGR